MGTRHGKAEDTVTADDDQHLDRDVTQRFSEQVKMEMEMETQEWPLGITAFCSPLWEWLHRFLQTKNQMTIFF